MDSLPAALSITIRSTNISEIESSHEQRPIPELKCSRVGLWAMLGRLADSGKCFNTCRSAAHSEQSRFPNEDLYPKRSIVKVLAFVKANNSESVAGACIEQPPVTKTP